MSIPLLDLQAQYLGLKAEIDKAVIDVLESGHYILGPNVKALEEEIAAYCGTKYAIGVANGTDALLLSLVAYGIGPGDEVITSPFTFFASAEVISQVGATPVFADIDPKTYNIDIQQLEAKITPKTKAIIPVHIFGQMADMDGVMALAEKHNLIVIEDACQAIGSKNKGRRAGSIGHTGCFSFFPTKNLGGFGDGGIIVTNDEEVNKKIRILRAHGSNPKYYHSMIGWNSRLDEIQAAVLRIKLRHLDSWNAARREKAAIYDERLANLDYVTPFIAEENETVYHLYIIQAKNRDELMAKFTAEGVGTGVYYPVPLHLQSVYKDLGYKEGDLPVAEAACKQTMALPLYPELSDEAMDKIVSLLK